MSSFPSNLSISQNKSNKWDLCHLKEGRKTNDLKKRVAALEKAVENGNSELKFALSCWSTVLLQFVEDFQISSPEVDRVVDLLKEKAKKVG